MWWCNVYTLQRHSTGCECTAPAQLCALQHPPAMAPALFHPCHCMISLAFCRSQATHPVSKGSPTPLLLTTPRGISGRELSSGGERVPDSPFPPSAASSCLPSVHPLKETGLRALPGVHVLPNDSMHESPASHIGFQEKQRRVQQDKFIHHLGEDTGKL